MDCQHCGKLFTQKYNKRRHEENCVPTDVALEITISRTCSKCSKEFSDPSNRRRHETICGKIYNEQCKFCDTIFTDRHNHLRHENACTLPPPPAKKKREEPKREQLLALIPDYDGVNEYETAFGNRLKSYFIRSDDNLDIRLFCESIKEKLHDRLRKSLEEYKAFKFNIFIDCLMTNQLSEQIDAAFKTKNTVVLQDTNLNAIISKAFSSLEKECEEAQLKKSGWSLYAIDGLRLRINKYKPLRGSTYIPLPVKIAAKKACRNVENTDTYCFKYAILTKFVQDHPERPSNYTNLNHRYDFSCMTFPTALDEIKKFEKFNNISINVFGVNKEEDIYPLKIADNELPDHRDLLLISNEEEKQHYVYIKDFERLVGKQISADSHKMVICKRCFQHYSIRNAGEERMEKHKEFCSKNKPVRIDLPVDKPYVKFEQVECALRVPFVVYCDFESILQPIQQCQPNIASSFTLQYQKHEPMSFCAYLKCTDDMIDVVSDLPLEPYVYRGTDAPKHCLQYLKSIAEKVSEIYQKETPMNTLTEKEQHGFYNATMCYMCDKEFTTDDKVRDHCHITGRYRGPAHRRCNLRYEAPKFLPVLVHNLSGYDSHFIVKELGYDEKEIDVIPNTEERYISFSKTINKHIKLRFLDTYRFMPDSLDKLVNNMPGLRETPKFFPADKLSLIQRKGIFPYEYVSSWSKLAETSLPPKSSFYSQLKQAHITDEEYDHATKVWTSFNCETLGDYSDLYLQTDTLLLADVFETFRNVTLTTHKLDPCQYFTLPGLSWDAMLRFTGIQLELLLDYDQIMMVEQGIRGGICQVSHRYIEANNKNMNDYNSDEESTYIAYQDCNNLYGFAMSKPLPFGNFEWISPEQINLENTAENDTYGYIFDVDIYYPENLHKLHNDLPFLAENIMVNRQKKLVPHLNDRTNYIVHYVALKQAINHGLKIKKINRVLRFKQSRWLKPYIDHNTQLRTLATNNFEKDLYKLYNNSVYGKTMENIRNRMDMKLVCSAKKIDKLIAKPDFIDRTIFNENLAAVHRAKKSIKFDKPIYVGMSILDLSKRTMYEYHYDVMIPKYGPEKIKLAYMDTDSFIYKITTEDLYKDMGDMLEHLDTSDYPSNHPLHSTANKKVLGKFKDEVNGKFINAFVGLRAKMYSLKMQEVVIRKAKGVQTAALQNNVTFEDYVNCLRNSTENRILQSRFQSKLHNITSVQLNKLALSPHDDKRVILEDGITTEAIGHTQDSFFPINLDS